jgi:inorganic phosphate transporter, PiT family
VIFGATTFQLPVSTTHVISSSVMGVGSAQRLKGVKWGVAQRIVLTWIVTLPVSALIAGFVYQLFKLFL